MAKKTTRRGTSRRRTDTEALRVCVVRDPSIRPGGDRVHGSSTKLTWTAAWEGATREGADGFERCWDWLIEHGWDLASGCLEGFRSFDYRLTALNEKDEVVRFHLNLKTGHLLIELSDQHFTPASVSALVVGTREWFIQQGAVAPHRRLSSGTLEGDQR